MKYLWFNSFLILFATCLEINCNFEKSSIINFYYANNLYICNVNKDPSITSPNIIITKVIGTHISMSHENVEGFYSDSISYKVHYIPHGVQIFFPKLVLICIYNSRVKEIHQSDLANYPKLKYLDLDENDIIYFELDLFEFNTKLKVVRFKNNKIKEIFSSVFDNLNQLEHINIEGSQCINAFVKTRSEVFEVLKEIKQKCVPEHHYEINNLNTKLNATIEKFNIMIQNLSVMNNIHNEQETKMKSEMNQFYLNLKIQINQQSNDQSSMVKTLEEEMKSNKKFINEIFANQSHEIEKSSEFQKFSSFVTQQEPTFFFIALPSFCLLTFLNIIMIYFCCYRKLKRNNLQRRARPVVV